MIKLDNIPIEHFGFRVQLEHNHPLVGEVRTKTMLIPGMPGAWDFGTELGPKNFYIPLGIIDYDNLEKQRKLNEFVAFLFDVHGRPREIKLTFNYEPDKYYLVKVAGGFSPERLIGFAFFTLPLIAHKPHKSFMLPSDEIVMDSTTPIMSDIMWDTGLSNREITSPEKFEIINNGTITIPFSFRMEGSGNNVSLSTSQKAMTFGSFSNKVIEVTDNYTVKVDGVTDLTATNGVFLDLLPGVNEITVGGSDLNLKISESLTYKYI